MTCFTHPALALPDLSLPDLGLPDLSLPDLSLPDLSLSDSLNSLSTVASQLQAVLNGVIAHPLWAIAIFLFTIALIQIIADLIKRAVRTVLTFVLRLPLSVSQWIWKSATTPSYPDQSAQVQQLITRLDALRAEQDQVIEQLKSVLAKKELSQEQLAQQNQLAVTEDRSSSVVVSPEAG